MSASVSEQSIRQRLVGCWRLVGYDVTAGTGETVRPLGASPLGTILYTPDGYMSAQLARPGPYASRARSCCPPPSRIPRRRADHDNDHLVTPAATAGNGKPARARLGADMPPRCSYSTARPHQGIAQRVPDGKHDGGHLTVAEFLLKEPNLV
jgi:Lipocalin-like domain